MNIYNQSQSNDQCECDDKTDFDVRWNQVFGESSVDVFKTLDFIEWFNDVLVYDEKEGISSQDYTSKYAIIGSVDDVSRVVAFKSFEELIKYLKRGHKDTSVKNIYDVVIQLIQNKKTTKKSNNRISNPGSVLECYIDGVDPMLMYRYSEDNSILFLGFKVTE